MKRIILAILIITTGIFTGCEDFLDRKNLDTFTSDNFWKSEVNLRLYAQQFYTNYFPGYGELYTYGPVFSWEEWADNQVSSSQWETNVAASGNGWSFTRVRSHNILIARTDIAPISDEAKNHWRGIGRFFRALEYAQLSRYFGDVPWVGTELLPEDVDSLYKPRDPMSTVVRKVLEDFEYAAANVRLDDGTRQINRYVVYGFMSRELLYFGTYLKYHNGDQALSQTLLQRAAWAANQIMASGKFAISDNYRGLFTSEDLSTNKEVIFYREYLAGKVTHAILSYNNNEGQTGITKDMFDSYLASDGFPIKQSPSFNYVSDQGRRAYKDVYRNRDPRMYATVVDSLRFNKVDAASSTTGIATWKFLPEVITTEAKFTGSNNVTNCPILRYGEVLLNYIEAVAELGAITQADLDKTINVLHNRSIRFNGKGTGAVAAKLPPFQLSGTNLAVNGTILDDPDRDLSVSPLLWEIRRERRAELIFEGFRKNDLRRWGKFNYLLTSQSRNNGIPTNLSIGAWVDTLSYPRVTKAAKWKTLIKNGDIRLYYPNPSDQGKGYILVLYDVKQQRDWVPGQSFFERQYLRSVPLDQITMYKDMGVTLTQNPGWE